MEEVKSWERAFHTKSTRCESPEAQRLSSGAECVRSWSWSTPDQRDKVETAVGPCEGVGFVGLCRKAVGGFQQRRDLRSLVFFNRLLWLLCTEKTGSKDGLGRLF